MGKNNLYRATVILIIFVIIAVVFYFMFSENRFQETRKSGEIYSHEPSGFTPIANREFNNVEEWDWIYNEENRFTIEIDSTAPVSPPFIGRAFFPKGWKGGYEPIATEQPISEYNVTKLYVSFFVKVSENWQGHPVYDKISYIWTHSKPVVMVGYVGGNANPLYSEVRIQDTPYGSDGAINFASNLNNVEIIRGKWHQWEIILISNTGNNRDGEIHWWLDGVKVGEYKNVSFGSAEQGKIWDVIAWRPVWGGGPATVEEDMYMYFDHYYASGKK